MLKKFVYEISGSNSSLKIYLQYFLSGSILNRSNHGYTSALIIINQRPQNAEVHFDKINIRTAYVLKAFTVYASLNNSVGYPIGHSSLKGMYQGNRGGL